VTANSTNERSSRKFAGKLSGETIKGKIDTDRDGQTTSADWEAKRGAAQPAAAAPAPQGLPRLSR